MITQRNKPLRGKAQWLASRIHGTCQMLATGVNGSAITTWQQHTTALPTRIGEQLADVAEQLETSGNISPD
ncbi:MAG: hypothetical protein ACRDJ9_33950 [Dehalococcoidia bacterium]